MDHSTETQPDRDSTEGTTKKNHGAHRGDLPASQTQESNDLLLRMDAADDGPRNTREV